MKGNGTERHQLRELSRALVPDLVLLTVLSCSFYGVIPGSRARDRRSDRAF